MIPGLMDEAVAAGARRAPGCQRLGLSARAIERWRGAHPEDARRGSRHALANKLSGPERRALLDTVNAAEWRDLSPQQIEPRLADQGQYLASDSTIYRVLRAVHRGRAKALERRPPREHVATQPDQV